MNDEREHVQTHATYGLPDTPDELTRLRADLARTITDAKNLMETVRWVEGERDAARADVVRLMDKAFKAFLKFTSTEKRVFRGPEGQTIGSESYILYYIGQQKGEVLDALLPPYPSAATAQPVVPPHSHSPSSSTYPLFEHMSREHGLTLVESELDEIRHAVARCGDVVPLEEAEATVRKP